MKEKQLQEMANRIKLRRMAMNFTQSQVAEQVGITLSSYSKIENAFQQPSLDTLIEIASKLNLSIDFILFGNNLKDTDNIEDIELMNAILKYSKKEKLLHACTVLKKLADIIDE